MGWTSWTELGGTTAVACTTLVAGEKLYLFGVGVNDKKVYFQSRGTNWSGWNEFGGTSDAAISAVFFDGSFHFFGKGIADKKIYIRSTQSIPGTKPWEEFGGTTDAAVSSVVFGNKLYVFAKGDTDNKIYSRSRSAGGGWGPWSEIGGTTDLPVATVVFKEKLYVFARGVDDKKLYWQARASGGSWSGWTDVGIPVGSAVAAAEFAGDLHLFARGLGDNHLYSLIVGRSNNWSPWFPLPPVKATTDKAVAVAKFKNSLHLFSKGIADKKIYTQSMNIYSLPFDDDGAWGWGRGNWDEPGGGHGPGDQFLDFDFNHPIGGRVRAARGGKVIFAENNRWNNSDRDSPNYNPMAPQGYGTAIHIKHDDDSTAAYMHLKFESIAVGVNDQVTRGQIIALSGHTGDSSAPHLHFGIHSSTDGRVGTGLHVPVYFKDKNHTAWRPKIGDELNSDNS